MLLTEQHIIKRKPKTEKLFQKIDGYCYSAKNLRNATNYITTQCSRISYKLKQGEILDSWEKKLIYDINCGISAYNKSSNKSLKYVDAENGFISDAYFLSWFLKGTKEYKDVPFATCSQIVIQNICRDWKAYYQGLKAYSKNPSSTLGRPHKPSYYDKETGRGWLTLTNQNAKLQNDGTIKLPKFLDGLNIKTRQNNINQVRIITKNDKIIINVLYSQDEYKSNVDKEKVLGIDLGVNNLMTVVSNTEMTPFIIDGKPLKSINQYYNKRKSQLQERAKKCNDKHNTKRMSRLTERRNNKVKDYMHKVSGMIIGLALSNSVGTIIIGNNSGWKQQVDMGKRTNQAFVGIPYYQLIQMITYKATLVGIEVKTVEESFTSGTSYLDGELPIQNNYNKARRITRGQFKSNTGLIINADVNAAYQIIKKCPTLKQIPIKTGEKVTKLKVA